VRKGPNFGHEKPKARGEVYNSTGQRHIQVGKTIRSQKGHSPEKRILVPSLMELNSRVVFLVEREKGLCRKNRGANSELKRSSQTIEITEKRGGEREMVVPEMKSSTGPRNQREGREESKQGEKKRAKESLLD